MQKNDNPPVKEIPMQVISYKRVVILKKFWMF